MKLGFLGDSVTEGVGATCPENNYVSVIGRLLGAEVKNYGISGTRIARQTSLSYPHAWDMDFNLRTGFIDNDFDYIFVFGGTNDYGHGDAPLGEKEDNTVYTFSGAINLLIDALKGKTNKLVFITSLNRFDEDLLNPTTKKPLKDYVLKMKEVLNYRKIPYLDFFNNLLEKPKTIENEGVFADGLHPNDKGYQILAKAICEYIKEDK